MIEKFRPHSEKQDELIFSDEEITIAGTGTQWGKSLAGSYWFKRQIHLNYSKDSNFILMAPTYKIMNQSMVPYFLNAMKGYGEYSKTDAVFRLNCGGSVYFRTEKDPDSIVGIPRVKAYWLDEAGKVGLYFWENILARAASLGAKGLLTTSPYSRNWLYKDFIKPICVQNKHIAGTSIIQAASWENPYHSLANEQKRADMQAKMDPRRFDMVFGGEWGKMSGLVYDCFHEIENMIKPFQLPAGTRYFGGIDWGFTEPFCLKIRAVTPDGAHYLVSEFYKSGMTIPMQIEVAKQKRSIYPVECFFAGPDRPENIEEFNRNGLPTLPANNDIRLGVDLHYELIKTRRFKIFEGIAPYTLDEIETYHYPEPEELDPDDHAKEQKPVGQNDHALDADRYLTIMTYNTGEKKIPHSNDINLSLQAFTPETYEKRIKRLRRKNYQLQTESFD